MKSFFNWIKLRSSGVKTFISIFKRDDSSKKVIYSVTDINVNPTLTNTTFTLDKEVSLISETAPFAQDDEVILSFKILGDTGPEGPPVDGGGVMPYEPFSNIVGHGAKSLDHQVIYCNQFIAPTSGNYSHLTIHTSKDSHSSFNGKLACAIYGNLPSSNEATNNSGVPGSLIAYKINDYTNTPIDLRRTYVTFEFPTPLQSLNANSFYWIAFSKFSENEN